MCLGVPGRIESIRQTDAGALVADADFVGEVRQVCLDYLPELQIGDYVIVHAGYALTKLTPESAHETIAMMIDLGLLESDSTPSSAVVTSAAREDS